ncbi:preprotein translocase subunit SecG [Mycoplasmopsis cynos]|nr:preprotein translocase subunit SecG [Mycoplasmopsis cynos]TQC54659.1 preprotein translocase subunit SecG [Mycoplasmopsis cynos]
MVFLTVILVIISFFIIIVSFLMSPDSNGFSGALVGSGDLDLFNAFKNIGQ